MEVLCVSLREEKFSEAFSAQPNSMNLHNSITPSLRHFSKIMEVLCVSLREEKFSEAFSAQPNSMNLHNLHNSVTSSLYFPLALRRFTRRGVSSKLERIFYGSHFQEKTP